MDRKRVSRNFRFAMCVGTTILKDCAQKRSLCYPAQVDAVMCRDVSRIGGVRKFNLRSGLCRARANILAVAGFVVGSLPTATSNGLVWAQPT
jgi:hypothetical protein